MSDPSTTPVRPPHVTIASGIVILGSLVVVLQMWERISGLQSLDTRTSLARYLADSRLGNAGVDVAQLTTIVRVAAMVAAACATAMLILGWQVTRRSRSARLALSILAAVLLLAGLVSDWFVESVGATFWAGGVGAAVMTLWLGPARLWFADSPATSGSGDRTAVRSPAASTAPPRPRVEAPVPPSPTTERPPPMNQPWPPTAWAPPPTSPYGVPPQPQAVSDRPAALLWACILTWFCTGLAAVVLVVSIFTLAQDAQPVLDEAYRQNPELSQQGFSQHDLLVMLYAVIALVLVCSAAAAGFAVVLFRGHRWAWYALLVTAGASTLFFAVGTIGSPVGLVPLAASVATFVCLIRPEVRAWLLRR